MSNFTSVSMTSFDAKLKQWYIDRKRLYLMDSYGTMISSIVLSYLANLEDPAHDWQRLKEHLDKLVPRIVVTRDTP